MVRPKKPIPPIEIKVGELRTIEDFDSLKEYEKETIVIYNKLSPNIRLIGKLKKEGDNYFVEGVAFEEDENGKHKIIAKRYGQTTNARYGLNQDEFETRKPAYFPNLNKYKRIKKDLERMLRLPNLGR